MYLILLLLLVTAFRVQCNRGRFTSQPTLAPTAPTEIPTPEPSFTPSFFPSAEPTRRPTNTQEPTSTPEPSIAPSFAPTQEPSIAPTFAPSQPTSAPSSSPTTFTPRPTGQPSSTPSAVPTAAPSSSSPTSVPSSIPTFTFKPSAVPTFTPTRTPTLSSRTSVTIDVELLLDEAISENLIGDEDVDAVIIQTLLEFLPDLDEDNIAISSIEDANARRRKLVFRVNGADKAASQHRRLQVDQTTIVAQLTFIVEELGFSSTDEAAEAIDDILQDALNSGALTEELNNNAVDAGVDDLFNAIVSDVDTGITEETLLFSFEPTSDPARSPSSDDDGFASWPLYGQILLIGGAVVVGLVVVGVLVYLYWDYCCACCAAAYVAGHEKEKEDDETSGGGSSDMEGGYGRHPHGTHNPLLCCMVCCAYAAERERKKREEAAAAESAAIAASPKRRYTYTSDTGQPLKVHTDVPAEKKTGRRGSLMAMLLERSNKKKQREKENANPNMMEVHADKAEVEMRCILQPAQTDGVLYSGSLTGAIEFDVLEFPTKTEVIEREQQVNNAAAELTESTSMNVHGGVMDAMFQVLMAPAESESVDKVEESNGAGNGVTGIRLPPVDEGHEKDADTNVTADKEATDGDQQSPSAANASAEHHHVPRFLKAGYWAKKLFKKNEHGEEVEVSMVELEAGYASVSTSSSKHMVNGSFKAVDGAAEEAKLMQPGNIAYSPVQYTPKSMLPEPDVCKSMSVDTQGTVMDAVFQALVRNPESLQAESAESIVPTDVAASGGALIPEENADVPVESAVMNSEKSAEDVSQKSNESAESSGGLSVLGMMFGGGDNDSASGALISSSPAEISSEAPMISSNESETVIADDSSDIHLTNIVEQDFSTEPSCVDPSSIIEEVNQVAPPSNADPGDDPGADHSGSDNVDPCSPELSLQSTVSDEMIPIVADAGSVDTSSKKHAPPTRTISQDDAALQSYATLSLDQVDFDVGGRTIETMSSPSAAYVTPQRTSLTKSPSLMDSMLKAVGFCPSIDSTDSDAEYILKPEANVSSPADAEGENEWDMSDQFDDFLIRSGSYDSQYDPKHGGNLEQNNIPPASLASSSVPDDLSYLSDQFDDFRASRDSNEDPSFREGLVQNQVHETKDMQAELLPSTSHNDANSEIESSNKEVIGILKTSRSNSVSTTPYSSPPGSPRKRTAEHIRFAPDTKGEISSSEGRSRTSGSDSEGLEDEESEYDERTPARIIKRSATSGVSTDPNHDAAGTFQKPKGHH